MSERRTALDALGAVLVRCAKAGVVRVQSKVSKGGGVEVRYRAMSTNPEVSGWYEMEWYIPAQLPVPQKSASRKGDKKSRRR